MPHPSSSTHGCPRWIPHLLLLLLLGAGAGPVGSQVRLDHHPERRELRLVVGPTDLPSAGGAHAHHGPEADAAGVVLPQVVTLPVSAVVHRLAIELVDRNGAAVPRELLHHVNVIRPERRELFLPVAQRLFAAGRETGDVAMLPFLTGLRIHEGETWEVLAMFHNATEDDFEGVELRIHLAYRNPGRVFPLLELHPFHLDVAFPVGDKSWDLPPGGHEWSWEGSPAIEGRVLALSGHLHDGAEWIRFEDLTAGRVIWEGRPVLGDDGTILAMPVGRLFLRGGAPLRTDHRYRVTVAYENATPYPIERGGMGVVGGVMVVSRGTSWPRSDPSDPLFEVDRAVYHEAVHPSWEDLLSDGRLSPEQASGRGGAWVERGGP